MKYIAFPQEEKNRNIFFSFLNYDYNSPSCEKIHFHKNYEFILVEEGIVDLFVDGNTYTLTKGQAIIIQPYQAHSFQSAALQIRHSRCHRGFADTPPPF